MSKFKNKPQPVKQVKPAQKQETPAPQVDIKSLNIYQKLQAIRKVVAEADIKRSSSNPEKGFTYLELPDYLPLINKLGDEYGIMTHFNMSNEQATLKIINTSNPSEVLEWTLPVKNYEMEGAQEVQILKGTTTYMRRTLFEVAFEISVKDTVDAQTTATKPVRAEDDLTQAQVDKIRGAKDLDELAAIAQEIQNAPGFNKEDALLKHYTAKKNELQA